MKNKEEKQKEKELVRSVKKNKKNFEEIFNLYYKRVVNYLAGRVSKRAVAEDLASEVFEKAYKAIDDFKWQGVSVSAWIFRIARNLLTDYYRKAGRTKDPVSLSDIENLSEDESPPLSSGVIQDEEEHVLYDSIREFNESDQFLIYYKFFEDLPNNEIGKIVGISESNVGTRLYRIRKKLRKYLEDSKVICKE